MPGYSSTTRPPALVLFCRKPALGEGKRRLAHSIGTEQAFAVATALLACALEDAAQWPGTLVISPARAEHATWAGDLLARNVHVMPQPEGTLGERIAAVDAAVRREGCRRVLTIGSDSPSLRLQDLCTAADALEHHDVALMPAVDGGVTLMGSRRPWPDLTALPWSEPTLGAALEHCCLEAGRVIARLAPSYDVDEAADVPRALEALADDARPARRRLHTLLRGLSASGTPEVAVP